MFFVLPYKEICWLKLQLCSPSIPSSPTLKDVLHLASPDLTSLGPLEPSSGALLSPIQHMHLDSSNKNKQICVKRNIR